MRTDDQSTEAICSGCPRCPSEDRAPEDEPHRAILLGWRLGFSAMGLFLGPVVLAIVGAVLSGTGPASQFAGAMVGLGVGLAVSVGVAKMLRREVGSGT